MLKSLVEGVRGNGTVLLRLFARQLDYVVSQRFRRTCSLADLYSRLWEPDRLRQVLDRVGRRLFRHHRRFLLGLSAFASPVLTPVKSAFDWHRLPDHFLLDHRGDVEYACELTRRTLQCRHCGGRHAIGDAEVESVKYCRCDKRRTNVYGLQTDPEVSWTPFLERKDIIVWRQPHPTTPGLFVYLMYGRFNDVTPSEFLEVQIDLSEFRLTWDKNSAQCFVLEEDLHEDTHSLSQIYYWEVNWPRFFANRDYVCNRRTQIFEYGDSSVGVVYSKAAVHPGAPKKPKNFRVEDYWSVMSVRPLPGQGWDDMGAEFSLIAFENPGLSLPSSVTTWVAIRGMPEFMSNLHGACVELRKHKQLPNASEVSIKPKVLLTSDYRVNQGSKPSNVARKAEAGTTETGQFMCGGSDFNFRL